MFALTDILRVFPKDSEKSVFFNQHFTSRQHCKKIYLKRDIFHSVEIKMFVLACREKLMWYIFVPWAIWEQEVARFLRLGWAGNNALVLVLYIVGWSCNNSIRVGAMARPYRVPCRMHVRRHLPRRSYLEEDRDGGSRLLMLMWALSTHKSSKKILYHNFVLMSSQNIAKIVWNRTLIFIQYMFFCLDRAWVALWMMSVSKAESVSLHFLHKHFHIVGNRIETWFKD